MKPTINTLKVDKLKMKEKPLKHINKKQTKLVSKKNKRLITETIRKNKVKILDDKCVVHQIKTSKYKKAPLPFMLKNCTKNMAIFDLDFKTIFEPKLSTKKCEIREVNYKLPEPNDDSDLEIPEMDSDDFGSEVESEEEQFTFVEEKVGRYKAYSVTDGSIILLYANSKLFMFGVMQINILYGSVDILGKHLDKMCPPTMVYSPRGSALLSIINRNIEESSEDTCRKSLKKQLLKVGLDSSLCHDVITFKLKANTVVLHCLNVTNKATDFLEANLAQKIYPKFNLGLRCKFKNVTSQEWNILQVSNEWMQLVNLMNSAFSTDGNNSQGNVSKLMLCGGKSVGKSTLLRYLTNKLLNTQKVVYILDLDPGQPEFTVPGAISLVRVSSPLLGPNYTHLQQPERCIFVSNINIGADHENYLGCVRKLSGFLQDLENVPVLVNYMGFTKGIGLFLTAEVLRLLQVDIVVQIESRNESRNFDVDLTPENMREQLAKSSTHFNENLRPGLTLKNYKLMKIDSAANSDSGNVGWELEPRQVREMCIFAYLAGCLPPQCRYLTEKDVPIYQTRLDSINIIYNYKPCDPAAANGNIVALCEEDRSICLGWGIVRGVCKETKRLLLLTPLKEEALAMVRNLVVGSVTLPPAIYLRHHEAIRGVVPYTFKGTLSNFAKSPKRSMVPKRA